MRTQCSIGGCTNPRLTRGLCNKHYQRWRRHGDPSIMLTGSPETRARQSAALHTLVRTILFGISPNYPRRMLGENIDH